MGEWAGEDRYDRWKYSGGGDSMGAEWSAELGGMKLSNLIGITKDDWYADWLAD